MGRAAHKNLLDIRLGGTRHAANGVAVNRGIAPAEHGKAFFADNAFENTFRDQPFMALHGHEHHAHAVLTRGRQREAQRGCFAGEKPVRNLNQEAGAITRLRVAATRPAMSQIDEDLDAFFDDVVRFLALDIGDETDATGIVFVGGVVEPLRRGQPVSGLWYNTRIHRNVFNAGRLAHRAGPCHFVFGSFPI